MRIASRGVASACLAAVLGGATGLPAQERGPLAWWRFEAVEQGKLADAARDARDCLSGGYKLVEGVSGKALRLDGFTTVITRQAKDAPPVTGAFSVDAWVALATYPWNWCPILAQEKDTRSGFFFGIGPQGQIGVQLAVGGRWVTLESTQKRPLRTFAHVAAVYSEGCAGRVALPAGDPRGPGR